MMKRLFLIFVVLAVIVGGYFAVRFYQDQQRALSISSLQTEPISRGNLTAMVGATGTVLI